MVKRIDILTLFPEMFDPLLNTSIVGRAVSSGIIEIKVTNIRDYATDRYGSVDDAPYGGGPGMVMMCQPVFDAVEAIRAQNATKGIVVLLTPQGQKLSQEIVKQLSQEDRLILIAGHYEGFDERIRQGLADMEISIGDFVLSGGEIPAMVIVDAVVRLLPGALGKEESTAEESFNMGLLEYPQYTRPREFRGMKVPDVLLSGDHARIDQWRRQQAEKRTMQRRPDLWKKYIEKQKEGESTPSAE